MLRETVRWQDTYKQSTLEPASCVYRQHHSWLVTAHEPVLIRLAIGGEIYCGGLSFSPSLPNLLSRTASEFTESQLSHSDQQSQKLSIISQGYYSGLPQGKTTGPAFNSEVQATAKFMAHRKEDCKDK